MDSLDDSYLLTLMKGLLPELTEEELIEADQELVRYRRQARSEGVYPDVGLLPVPAWSQMRLGIFFSRVHGHFGLDVSLLSGSVIDASLATFPSYVWVLRWGAVRQRRERGSCEPEYIQCNFGCSVQLSLWWTVGSVFDRRRAGTAGFDLLLRVGLPVWRMGWLERWSDYRDGCAWSAVERIQRREREFDQSLHISFEQDEFQRSRLAVSSFCWCWDPVDVSPFFVWLMSEFCAWPWRAMSLLSVVCMRWSGLCRQALNLCGTRVIASVQLR